MDPAHWPTRKSANLNKTKTIATILSAFHLQVCLGQYQFTQADLAELMAADSLTMNEMAPSFREPNLQATVLTPFVVREESSLIWFELVHFHGDNNNPSSNPDATGYAGRSSRARMSGCVHAVGLSEVSTLPWELYP
eukprot:3339420-Rhodomonas_salina.2